MPTPLAMFDYALPPERIAQHPLPQRDASRMMVLHRNEPGWQHQRFLDLPQALPPNALLVFNNTRVSPRRLLGTLPRGTATEALLIEEVPAEACNAPPNTRCWRALVKKAKRLKPGMRICFAGGALMATATERPDGEDWVLCFDDADTFWERLHHHGLPPLPPYIERHQDSDWDQDREAYQTCFAEAEGALAAPTAGLHFTPAMLTQLEAAGFESVRLTLHVGLGTFMPVRSSTAEGHQMHEEWMQLTPEAAQAILSAKAQNRPIIAIGTTAARALESWGQAGSPPQGWSGQTGIFIYPPYSFLVVDGLLTNFHLPQSTLLMLVSALHGREAMLAAYQEAVQEEYRFFSYGDCMLIRP